MTLLMSVCFTGCTHKELIEDIGIIENPLGSHGGGDLRLAEDFVHVLLGQQPSVSCTRIEDSINGHLAVFLADRARETGQVVAFPRHG